MRRKLPLASWLCTGLLQILVLSLFVIFAIVFNSYVLAKFHRVSIEEILDDAYLRMTYTPIIDGIAPAYRQSSQDTCGAAAMTYLLARMGDLVFESDFIALISEPGGGGYSFADMARFAESRGFDSIGYKEGSVKLLPTAGEPPVIAHLSEGHFVVVLSHDKTSVTLFDPAYGSVLTVPGEEFDSEWSGRYLRVFTRSVN